MDTATLLARIVGAALFLWTAWSIYKHIHDKLLKRPIKGAAVQSMSEAMLNNVLYYLWLAFMIAFSLGMIFNN